MRYDQKKLIRQAFMELIQQKKDVTKITVTDISRIADINRSTFYAHYKDVYSVIEEIEEEIINKMIDYMSVDYLEFTRDPEKTMRAAARQLESNEEYYKLLLKTDGASEFLTRLQNIFLDYVLEEMPLPDYLKDTADFRNRCSFFAGGITKMVDLWHREQLGTSLEDAFADVSKINPHRRTGL